MLSSEIKIAVIGLGYVGLPLAVEFGKRNAIIGFDIKQQRIAELRVGLDSSKEISVDELRSANIQYTNDAADLREANFFIVAVPTPIDKFKKPDLSPVVNATEIIGKNMRSGAIVVYESTVYPGVTEEICGPLLERCSGLRRGVDFTLGYSPERTNPGDKAHAISQVVKIVSGEDAATLATAARVYSTVCLGGVYQAPDIRTAEAAKVIENIQRDLNIAVINELSLIFARLGINTREVLRAAGTKWNFHHYEPGLVGGHCIGVDPYYLTYLSESVGYIPQVILAGRRINDSMADYAAELIVRGIIESGKVVLGSKVLILGLTFKENVRDTRNSKVKDIVEKLQAHGIIVYAHDPLLTDAEVREFGVNNLSELDGAAGFDGVAICVPHDKFRQLNLNDLGKITRGRAVLVDIKGLLAKSAKNDQRFIYKTF